MTDKPKRWTWEKFKKNEGFKIQYLPQKTVFNANEPLIDWQEKEIERLRGHNEGIYESLKEKVSQVIELKKRIEELENYLGQRDELIAQHCLTISQQDKIITKLREALEYSANNDDGHGTLPGDIHAELAREVLKECFGEEE